jgi:hypothetical protein
MDILQPDKYCKYWRVLYCGDEIIVDSKEEAEKLISELQEKES